MKPLIDYTLDSASEFIRTLLKHLPEMATASVATLFSDPPKFRLYVKIDGRAYSRDLPVTAGVPWRMPDADIYQLATDITHEHWQSMLDI